MNETISLTSIADCSVKLTRNGEPNNLFLHLAMDGHCQKKWIIVSSLRQWLVSMNTVVEMMSRSSSSNWFVRLPSIKGQVSPVMEQNSSLTQDRLASRKNFRTIVNLKEASGISRQLRKECTISGELVGSTVSQNVTVPGYLDQSDTEAPRKKVETAAPFPKDPGIIHKICQRS